MVVRDLGFQDWPLFSKLFFAEILLVGQLIQTSNLEAQIEKMRPRSHGVRAWNEVLWTPGIQEHHHRKLEFQSSAHNSGDEHSGKHMCCGYWRALCFRDTEKETEELVLRCHLCISKNKIDPSMYDMFPCDEQRADN